MKLSVFILGCLAAAPVFACDYPNSKPEIPDGKTSTSDQMVQAQAAVKDYVSKMQAYIDCVDQTQPPAAGTLSEEEQKAQEKVQIEKHNAAVDEMQALADRYNAEVRAFKEVQQDSKH